MQITTKALLRICLVLISIAAIESFSIIQMAAQKPDQKSNDINAKDKDGRTALINAAMFSQTKNVKALLEKGADVNIADKDKRTALIWAAIGGNAETVKALLAAGADVNAQDKDGKPAAAYAKDSGNKEALTMIVEAVTAKAEANKSAQSGEQSAARKPNKLFTSDDAETKIVPRGEETASKEKKEADESAKSSKDEKDKEAKQPDAAKAENSAKPDPDADLPSWFIAQRNLVNRYFELQSNGESIAGFFCGTDYKLFNVRSWKIVKYQTDVEGGVFKVKVESSNRGGLAVAAMWLVYVKNRPGVTLGMDDYCIAKLGKE